jgi:hypothetical protein
VLAGFSDVSVIQHNLKRPSWSYEMMKRIAEASPRFKARIAGALFLFGSLSAVFGEFFVRRLEIAADLIAVSSMIAVTLLLYGISSQ